MAGLLLVVSLSRCQGTVNFANAGATFSAPFYDYDGVTRLSGSRYMAELLAGTSTASMAPAGSPTPFLAGGGAGFFNGGVVAILSVAPGSIGFFQVRVWDTTVGATYSAAQSAGLGYGFSNIFSGPTGGVGTPPSSPTSLAGLQQSFTLIPEPSIYALLALGGVAMFFRRRK